jgi:hypothetical protein
VKTQTVQSSRLLLIGNDAAAPLIAEDYFIRAGPDYEATIHQLAVYLLGENTAAEVKSILVNEPIQVQTGDYDTELDEIINPRWMIIHDQSTVDKPLGAYSQSTPLRNEAAWIAEKPIPFLDKPGSYELIRKVKDTPVTNCSTCDYGLDSNEASLKLFVHRQPIAQLLLTATYSSQNKNFHLVWQDISYDPDNAIRRADKGIVARQFRYHSVGQTSWKYTMPSVLTPGSYTAEFAVQDVNEAWSEDYSISFQLKSDGTVAYEIIPEINHTEGWQTYHLYRGDETNQAPKDFFAGEQLLLDAVLPSRNAEYIQASCQMMTVHDRIVTTSVRLQTRDNLGLQYGETLFNPAWSNPKDPIRKGLYQVTFTTKFKTGTTTVAEVPIRIIGSIYESYGVQRLK